MNNSSLNKIAWVKFKKNKLALFSLVFITLLSILAVFPYTFMTDKTEYASDMNLELSTLPPFAFLVLLLVLLLLKHNTFLLSILFWL